MTPKLSYPRQNDKAKYDQTQAYADSKLANILFTVELQRRFGPKGINAYAVHPGVVATELGRHINKVVSVLTSPIKVFSHKTPLQGAQTTLYTILSPHAIPGGYHSDAAPWRSTEAAKDVEAAKAFWTESERVTKIA
jgi:NAD(P)-dependent dehydrogenase (short-subunit alcohol dehydrogenase family)